MSQLASAESPLCIKMTKIQNVVKYTQLKIQHLNDFATLEYLQLDAKMEKFSVQAMIDDVIQNLKKRGDMSNVDLTLKLSQ